MTLLILLLAAFPAVPAEAESEPRSCEPGTDVEMSAQVLSIAESGDEARVVIQLTLDPATSILAARIRGSIQPAATRPRRAVARDRQEPSVAPIPDRVIPLAAGLRRRLLYEMTLPGGRSRDIFFSLLQDGSGEPFPGATAWVRLPLDPAERPERVGGVLQYRTRTEGR